MAGRNLDASPGLRARIAGLFYFGTIAGGVFALALRMGAVVRGDAGATAANLMTSEFVWRAALWGELLGIVCYVGVTAMLYDLLKPAGRTLSQLAAFVSLTGCAVGAAASAHLTTPLLLLDRQPYLDVFSAGQLEAMALTSLRLHTQAYNLGMVFFGFYCLLIGWLVFRSGFLPRILGVLLAGSGIGWLVDSSVFHLAPEVYPALGPFPMIAGFLGEAALTVWLIIKGVDVPRWRERAVAAEASQVT